MKKFDVKIQKTRELIEKISKKNDANEEKICQIELNEFLVKNNFYLNFRQNLFFFLNIEKNKKI